MIKEHPTMKGIIYCLLRRPLRSTAIVSWTMRQEAYRWKPKGNWKQAIHLTEDIAGACNLGEGPSLVSFTQAIYHLKGRHLRSLSHLLNNVSVQDMSAGWALGLSRPHTLPARSNLSRFCWEAGPPQLERDDPLLNDIQHHRSVSGHGGGLRR